MKYSLKNPGILNISEGVFGGDQAWFSDERNPFSKRGCGIIGAANTIIYLAFTRDEYRALYPFEYINKNNYIRFMNILSYYIRPSIMGIPSIGILNRGINSYTKEKNIILNNQKLIKCSNKLEIMDFIISALQKDTPVLSVNWNHRRKILSYHWITITRLEMKNDWKLGFSSWGKYYSMDLKDFIYNNLYNGMMYYY
ncbi:MAG: hypothetical protein Q4P34_05190 [Tissierellia bacterium]|nr:hypothetical protein [Tissierellia bacterium]